MKVLAFLKKDFYITISYRFAFLLRLGTLVITLFMMFFIGKTFSGTMSPYLGRYGGDYFPYVLVGIAVSSFVSVGLGALAREVRSAQVEGTLEAMLSTPTSIYTILIGNSLWTFFEALFQTVFLLGVGVIFLNFKIDIINIFAASFILFLTFLAFLVIGMMSAAFIMIFKQGNPIQFIFGTSSYFLGGIIFPVEVLPKSFQYASTLLPITHAVKAIRELLLAGTEVSSLLPLIFNLVLFTIVLSPISIFFFRYAIKRAKKDGSLVQF